MKNLVLLFLLLNVILYSQTYKMNINMKDGSKVEFSVGEIQTLTFGPSMSIKDFSDMGGKIEGFSVSQNYPNPFNPTTTISYQIHKTSLVKINVFDVQGSLVKELFNGMKEAGEYKINWNGTNEANINVSSGVYIYTVSIENKVISKQMILLR